MDWAGGLLETFHGVFIGAFLFSVALFKASRQSPSAVHPCTEEAQDRRQSVTSGSSDTKRSACESSPFSHYQQVCRDKFPFLGAKHWRYTPPFTTMLCCLQFSKLKGRVLQPYLPLVQIMQCGGIRGLQVCTYFQNELLG